MGLSIGDKHARHYAKQTKTTYSSSFEYSVFYSKYNKYQNNHNRLIGFIHL